MVEEAKEEARRHWAYYDELIKQGFNEEQAWELLLIYRGIDPNA